MLYEPFEFHRFSLSLQSEEVSDHLFTDWSMHDAMENRKQWMQKEPYQRYCRVWVIFIKKIVDILYGILNYHPNLLFKAN